HYPTLFALTLIPGVLAAAFIAFAVKERERTPVPYASFGASLRALPTPFRKFLLAVGLFGAGDFASALLILLATQELKPVLGKELAVSVAAGLYVALNVFYAAFSLVAGWLADRFPKARILAAGYAMAALMATLIITLPLNVWTLTAVFVLRGVYVAIEETLEDSLCAELVAKDQHGMGFGVLATVNGVGDFVSSAVVGALWSAFGTSVAFGYSAILFVAGTVLVLRIQAK
ncbi:MAG: MFS transporter, partial [Verrucomicrobiae bacterium]|nr:MFS transporter [Verrucomicrobiae bacterium]